MTTTNQVRRILRGYNLARERSTTCCIEEMRMLTAIINDASQIGFSDWRVAGPADAQAGWITCRYGLLHCRVDMSLSYRGEHFTAELEYVLPHSRVPPGQHGRLLIAQWSWVGNRVELLSSGFDMYKLLLR